jgi:recombination protein RecA
LRREEKLAMTQDVLRLVERREMDKQKALDSALAQIERAFGKGSIMKLGAQGAAMDIEAVSTGSIGLDVALGIGGLPKGRIIEIYGPESSGKTTLALHVVAEEQRKGGVCAFVDAEHALDPVYARKLGVDIDEMLISQPDAGEQALEITDTLVRSGAVSVVVVDSVAALTPRAELEGDMGDAQVGAQARLMSQAMRKLTGSIHRSNCMVIFINQIRQKIGVMFGSPETTTGGNALKFYASVRLDIRRIGAIKDRDEVVGNATRVKVVKNKVAPPFKQVEFDIMYGEGISKMGELIDLGVKAGVVEKSGAWFSYGDQRIGQGRENAKQFLRDNPDIAFRSRTASAPPTGWSSRAAETTRTTCWKPDPRRGAGARGADARCAGARPDGSVFDAAGRATVAAHRRSPPRGRDFRRKHSEGALPQRSRNMMTARRRGPPGRGVMASRNRFPSMKCHGMLTPMSVSEPMPSPGRLPHPKDVLELLKPITWFPPMWAFTLRRGLLGRRWAAMA